MRFGRLLFFPLYSTVFYHNALNLISTINEIWICFVSFIMVKSLRFRLVCFHRLNAFKVLYEVRFSIVCDSEVIERFFFRFGI